jgi:uncharacterized OB-fold protein
MRPIHEGLFTSHDDPRGAALLAGQCGTCRRHHFPAAETCPYCSGETGSIEAVGATGRIYLHTVVQTAPPGYTGPVPYGFGLVDLPEGLRVVTRLTATNLDALASGSRVRLEIAPLCTDEDGNEVLSWSYRLDGGAA